MNKFADIMRTPPAEGFPFVHWHRQLGDHAAAHPQRIAARYAQGERSKISSLTYAEFDQLSRSTASHLQQLSARQAIVTCEDNLWFLIAMSACFYAGVTAVPAAPPLLDPGLKRLSAILSGEGSHFILTTSGLASSIEIICKRAYTEQHISIYQIDTLPDVAAGWSEPNLTPDSIAYLQYTSGSTLNPRGVIISHRQLAAHLGQLKALFGFDQGLVSAGWLPLHHDFGFIILGLLPLFYGGTTISMPPQDFMRSPVRWLQMLSDYQAQMSPTPDFGLSYTLKHVSADSIRDFDLTHLRWLIPAGEPNRKEIIEAFAAFMQPTGLTQSAMTPSYGVAEAILGISSAQAGGVELWLAADADTLDQNRFTPAVPGRPFKYLVTCGTPLAGVRVVIVHPETRQRLLEDEIGEIWVAGIQIGDGYWHNPQATAEQFGARLPDDETLFLRTGDLGFIHDQVVYVTGRLKEVMIVHGRNLYPQDFEAVTESTSPLIRPGGSGVFSTRRDEEVVIVVAEVKQDVDFQALENLARGIAFGLIHNFQVQPYEILLVAPKTIPKTTSGKRQRILLRKRYERNEIPTLYRWKRG